jgi:hypothetical protein
MRTNLEGLNRSAVTNGLIWHNVGFHIQLTAWMLAHNHLEKVGWDGNIILPDNFVVNIIFSIWLPPEM